MNIKKEWVKLFINLSDMQAGQLIKIIFRYSENSEEGIITDDTIVHSIAKTIIQDIDEKHLKINERNRTNGQKGGRPAKPKKNPKTQLGYYSESKIDSGKANEKNANKNPNNPLGFQEKTWQNDFNIYLNELRTEYKKLINNVEFIQERQKFHPGLNIKLSLEKSCKEYWATEAGWKKKKAGKTKDLNWTATLTKALDLPSNKVWQQKAQQQPIESSPKRKIIE